MKHITEFTFQYDFEGNAIPFTREIEILESLPDDPTETHLVELFVEDDIFQEIGMTEELGEMVRDEYPTALDLEIYAINKNTNQSIKL